MRLLEAAANATLVVWSGCGCWLLVCRHILVRRPPSVVRTVYWLLRPLVWPAGGLAAAADVYQGDLLHAAGWLAVTAWIWWWYRHADDDDWWRRRKAKLAAKVARVGARLTVVSAGTP